jgi:mannosyltransferase
MFKALLLRLKSTKKIISISNTTKNELIKFGISSNSIEVIHHCTDLNVDSEKHKLHSLSKIKSGRPLNVVYIANDIPYKNISIFIRIAEQLSKGNNHNKFVFTLLSKVRNENLELLRRSELNNLSVIEHLDRLEDFYEMADILLFPSSYEGFGRPLIEAMKSGIPIVGRNIPIIREITGNASILVDSDRIDEWIGALTLLYDFSEYEDMANKSIKRSAEFSIEKFNLRVAKFFRSILQPMDTRDG